MQWLQAIVTSKVTMDVVLVVTTLVDSSGSSVATPPRGFVRHKTSLRLGQKHKIPRRRDDLCLLSARRDLNPQPTAYKAVALPLSYRRIWPLYNRLVLYVLLSLWGDAVCDQELFKVLALECFFFYQGLGNDI